MYNDNIYFSLYKKIYNKVYFLLYKMMYNGDGSSMNHHIRRPIMIINIYIIHESVFLIIQDDV